MTDGIWSLSHPHCMYQMKVSTCSMITEDWHREGFIIIYITPSKDSLTVVTCMVV